MNTYDFSEQEITSALKKFKWNQASGSTADITYSFGDNAIITSY